MDSICVLLKKDWRCTRNLGRVLRRESRFKIVFVLLFASALVGGLFALFLDGFEFLADFGGAGLMITRRLFSLFFMGLGIMLVTSSVVTSYATFFRSREVPFLLVKPFDVTTIVNYKYLGSSALSSWAFFFMIIPFVGAYAWHHRLGAGFCLWVLLFSVPFLFLCSGLGTLVRLLLVRWITRARLTAVIVLLAAAGGIVALRVQGGGPAAGPPGFVISRIVPGLRAASLPLVPSWWVAEGIMASSGGQLTRGLMLGGVLLSNALMAGLLVEWLGRRNFYAALQFNEGSRSRARRGALMFPRLERSMRFLARDVRGLVVKDIRAFVRDPVQWSQALIFFGLLGLYFSGIRSFRYHTLPREWRNLIAFLNVFSVSAVMCSLASRFVYPQLSLEGQAFWILGLSPTSRSRILMTKFVLALSGMLAVSLMLMFLSSNMLRVDPVVRVVAMGVAAAISFAVSGLSVGLGAVFLNLKQSNPMAIVSGFGGTINLFMSLVFMLAAIIPFGLIFHLSYLGHMSTQQMHKSLVMGGIWLLGLTAAATALPLWLGQRSLARRDY